MTGAKGLIVLDSSVVIPLANGESRLERGRERALAVVRHHRECGEHVVIPAPAFSEVCHCEHPLLRSLYVPVLNAVSAMIANQITPTIIQESRSYECSRTNAKVDALILAIAVEQNASILYAEDPWFKPTAEREGLSVRVLEPPPVPAEQLELIASELEPPS